VHRCTCASGATTALAVTVDERWGDVDFELSEEQREFRDFAKGWVDSLYPKNKANQLEGEDIVFPEGLWKDMADAGFHGIGIDEEYGGQGGDAMTQVILARELARNLAGLAAVWGTSSFAGGKTISSQGNEEQKQRFLPGIAAGELKFSISITEPAGGTDVIGAMRTNARRVDGGWRINGQKIWTTGGLAADYLVVMARTGETNSSKTMTSFIVDAKSEGVTIRKIPKLGMRSMASCEVFYDDVFVPDDLVLGEPGQGWYQLLPSLNNERIQVGGFCLGFLDGILEDALAYLDERTAFGHKIGEFQALQHYVADIATARVQTELLTYKAAWLQSNDLPCGLEATMAKMVASEHTSRAADLGIQMLGGMGYSMETNMQRYWRDSRIYRIAPVTTEMAKNIIAQQLGLPRSF